MPQQNEAFEAAMIHIFSTLLAPSIMPWAPEVSKCLQSSNCPWVSPRHPISVCGSLLLFHIPIRDALYPLRSSDSIGSVSTFRLHGGSWGTSAICA